MKSKPRLIVFANYGNCIELKILINSKVYHYQVPVTAYTLGLQRKKRFTFKDLNKIKKMAK